MTILAACRFHDGVVLLTDSRATWLPSGTLRDVVLDDRLQKIVPLTRNICIGFAGDAGAFSRIVRQIRQRLQRETRLHHITVLANDLPRIARHYYQVHRSRSREVYDLTLILAGVSDSGVVEVSSYSSPTFERRVLREPPFVVYGSGAQAEAYLRKHWRRLNTELPTLKARADAMLTGLEGELENVRERGEQNPCKPNLVNEMGARRAERVRGRHC